MIYTITIRYISAGGDTLFVTFETASKATRQMILLCASSIQGYRDLHQTERANRTTNNNL